MALEYLTVEHLSTKDLIRIFSKIEIHPDVSFNGTPCWIWCGQRHRQRGHAQFKWKRSIVGPYRVLFAWAFEPIPKGRYGDELDHLCRVPQCCNPNHLELVSHRVNLLRGHSPIGLNVLKTHCIRGHSLVGDNLYRQPAMPNTRQCRKCMQRKRRIRTERDRLKASQLL